MEEVNETNVFVLEQLSRSKKQSSCFLCPERFSDIEKIYDACQECPALSWTDWRVIENASLLNDSGFVVIIRVKNVFVLLLRVKCHSERRHFF